MVEHKSGLSQKLFSAIKRAAMETEEQSSVHLVHDCFEEAPSQADLKLKLVSEKA